MVTKKGFGRQQKTGDRELLKTYLQKKTAAAVRKIAEVKGESASAFISSLIEDSINNLVKHKPLFWSEYQQYIREIQPEQSNEYYTASPKGWLAYTEDQIEHCGGFPLMEVENPGITQQYNQGVKELELYLALTA